MVAVEVVSTVHELLDHIAALESERAAHVVHDSDLIDPQVVVVEMDVERFGHFVSVRHASDQKFVRDSANARRERADQVVGRGQEMEIEQEALEALLGIAHLEAARKVRVAVVVHEPVLWIAVELKREF